MRYCIPVEIEQAALLVLRQINEVETMFPYALPAFNRVKRRLPALATSQAILVHHTTAFTSKVAPSLLA